MMNFQNIVSSQTKIRFQHCDPFNHLNNGSYIDYFMNHREDQLLKHYDIDIYKMARTKGISWVSSSNQIAYLKPALLMETVTIESQLIAYDTSSLKVEMRMYNSDKTQLKAVIWCGFVHFNLLEQSRALHSDEMMKLFESILVPIGTTNFEERLLEFKAQKTKL
ncbi:thioesterase family protein [Psychroserpens sp. SPM9]|uniref:acyl-CoA thioesterase n=1 Tax=Psychroserpens sp. SPM9 TaxID=2975598 RepID=UPI0021A6567A|nr:acyl-CoA thioesterase [Psychroserpens sp. SPM9]MDG5491744.1 acyl-CoA thioesterase [Psychroserpens sp. SPM9]